jgi:VWFA-related protein
MNVPGASCLTLLLLTSAALPAQQATPAFRAETNLVLVPVVVRNAKGEAVANLTKADFHLFDNGKEQAIASFSVEETSGQVAPDRSQPDANPAPQNSAAEAASPASPAPMIVPEHYVALLFDDQHVKNCDPDPPPGYIGCIGDLWHSRDAAKKMIKTLKPTDRVGVFTSSGQVMLDFTSDRAKIDEALMKLREGKPVLPTVANSGLREREVENQTEEAINFCGGIVKRMSHLPGQRTLVFISPGLKLHGDDWSSVGSAMYLIDNSIRARVVINSLDARGLTYERAGAFWEFQQRVTDGTGGTFIRDTNDLNSSIERLAATPKYIYVLGFSPQDIKQDGSFHRLTVKLREGHNLEIQARAGYAAPDAKELARKASQPKATPAAAPAQVSEADTQQVAKALGIATPAAITPTFKAETNLVLVPVVVRDSKGDVVGGLGKSDFQLLRDGQPQPIATFALEETSNRTVEDRSVGEGPKAPAVIPEHFAALMFDDAHFDFGRYEDIVYSRNAVLKYLDTLQSSDRVALFTSSGLFDVDFTTDHAKIQEALLKIAPGPSLFYGMPPDEVARLIVGKCDKIVSRMALLPGTRTLVFISAGLPVHGNTWSAVPDTMRLIDRAIRSRVVIGAMDVRGLSEMAATTRAWEFQMDVSEGTGGKFIRDTNDLDGAVRQLAATPKYIYVLGFSPDTAKGKPGFHKLEVKLPGRKLDVQARNGYSDGDAPPPPAPVTTAKVETPRVSEAETKELTQALGIRAAASAKNDEMVTTEQPATFKVQTNLVEVPVIVRDRAGHAIGNLKQEDFHITDKGKRQEITKFAIVKSAAQPAPVPDTKAEAATPGASTPAAALNSPSVPTRFVAFVFDDVHLQFADLPQVRNAVVKYLNTSLAPQDRVALVTTSGKNSVDFTAKPDEVNAALLKVVPNPFAASPMRTCMYVSYFQAVQIDQQVGLHPSMDDLPRSLPLRVAYFDASQCLHDGDSRSIFNLTLDEIRHADENGQRESQAALAGLKELVRRMAVLPGQRAIILVSPGFFVSPELQTQNNELEALAIRSKVLINTIDARGVWTDPGFDASRRGAAPPPDLATFRVTDANVAADELIALAEDTGGTVHMNNDFLEGVRKAAAAPEYLYILGFVPQDLKLDGSFHTLKVTASSGEKLTLQARRGYWAPKHSEDEAAVSKQQIEDAVFSRDEIHSLPVDMHTQLSKSGEQSKLTVLTSVDLKLVHLRKADDRNRNDLTIVAALFDTNGNFVVGTQKLLELRLRDETVARLEQKPPIVINTDFDVKPGGYLVRLVVRDAEGQQVTAENAAVRVQ